ncbi:MAG: hypothetical protein GF311_26325 [Candidatus Lokiarchaeota archaeon]|nr:hypothetical protein [Candidatus Lokiarchaeota archaeon]
MTTEKPKGKESSWASRTSLFYRRLLHRAIAYVLKSEEVGYHIEKLEKELRFYSATYKHAERKAKLVEIMDKIKPFIKTNIIEIHHDTKKLGQRENMYTKKLPVQKLVEMGIISRNNKHSGVETLDTKENGLNMVYGGGGGTGMSLPLYDIAVMISLGLTGPKIADLLQSLYFEIRDNQIERTVQHYIEEYFGGTFESQQEFLMPIIEHLVKEGIDRHEIYLWFKDAEVRYGWFLDWSYGKELLKNDYKVVLDKYDLQEDANWEDVEEHLEELESYYCGIPESKWLEWAFYSIPIKRGKPSPNTIEDYTLVSERKIRNAYKYIYSKFNVDNKIELKYELHKREAIRLINQGFLETPNGKIIHLTENNYYHIICKYSLLTRKTKGNSKIYFETILFKDLTIKQIWDKFKP